MKTLIDIAGLLLLGTGFILVVSEPETINVAAIIWKAVGFGLAYIGYRFMMASGKYNDDEIR